MTEGRIADARFGVCRYPLGAAPSKEVVRLYVDLDGDDAICTEILCKLVQFIDERIVVGRQAVAINAAGAQSGVIWS